MTHPICFQFNIDGKANENAVWTAGASKPTAAPTSCVKLTCTNEHFDPGFGETDTDCGGSRCRPCSGGKDCNVDDDCASGTCDTTTTSGGVSVGTCTDGLVTISPSPESTPDTCANAIQDGYETDVGTSHALPFPRRVVPSPQIERSRILLTSLLIAFTC